MKKRVTLLIVLLMASISCIYAQQLTITGTVIDKNLGDPIIGATILVKGTTIGTVTDVDGNFSIEASKNNVLEISYVGYQAQSIKLDGIQRVYRIELSEDTQNLDEVVVVGFGTQKKVNLTGAVATVDTKTLESRPVTSVAQALQGVVPGLNVSANNRGGKLDQSPTMNIRGTGNLGTGSSDSPLVLIDGVEGDINSLNPQDIANISVLKDAASASIYGSRAPFGVILVTTKSGEKGKTTIQYSDNFRWARPTNIPDMLDSYRFAKYFNYAQANSGQAASYLFDDDTIDRIQQYMAGTYQYTSDPTQQQGANFFQFNMRSNDNQNWPSNSSKNDTKPAQKPASKPESSKTETSTAKPKQKVWVDDYKTVHHERKWIVTGTHEEDVYDYDWVNVCNDCGMQLPDSNTLLDHLEWEADHGGKGSYHAEKQKIKVGTKTVEDGYWKEAYDEKVKDGGHWEYR